MKVIHCPSQIGGNPAVIAKYERNLGLDSHSITEGVNYLGQKSDFTLSHGESGLLSLEIQRIKLILNILTNSDVLHLNNGRFITPFFGNGMHPREKKYSFFLRILIRIYANLLQKFEMSIYKLNPKCIFVTFQGSDARETKCFINKYQRNGLAKSVITRSGNSNDSIRRKKILLSEVADKVYSLNPDLLEVLPKGAEFLPYATESSLNSKILPYVKHSEFVVGHAPTHRIVKGTDIVIEVIEKLRMQGYKIRLELIEGLTREKALKKYEQLDLFIDQLIIGWYGVVSLEVLALGKPVLCFVKGKDCSLFLQKCWKNYQS